MTEECRIGGLSSPETLFTTLGMFIIDEIHLPTGESHTNIVGGGGSWAVLGSRLFLPAHPTARWPLPYSSRSVGWIVDVGKSFPQSTREELENWEADTIFREDFTRETTFGWNFYGPHEHRDFKYLTRKKRITVDCLKGYPRLVNAECVHLLCSPERAVQVIADFRKFRDGPAAPQFVYEPIPDEARPETLETLKKAAQYVRILSPNAEEGARFLGYKEEPRNRPDMEAVAEKLAEFLRPECFVVLRCGENGSIAVESGTGRKQWFPAYHEAGDVHFRVVDPTGAGNCFLGGCITGYSLGLKLGYSNWGAMEVGNVFGNVASGLAIEQLGMPHLEYTAEGMELWNGETVGSRMRKYEQKYGVEMGRVIEMYD